MIKEAYCSFEVAKLMKEKGFNEPCFYYYKDEVLIFSPFLKGRNSYQTDTYSAPTHQMAMAWLREEKNIFIVIEPHAYDYVNEKNESYVCSLWVGDNYYEYIESRDYPSYEEAVEAALKYVLKNLI